MVDYVENREAVHIAEEIIPEFHPHLVGVHIAHISKVKPPSKARKEPRVGKKVVMAKTAKVSEKMRRLMEINWNIAPTPPYFMIEYDDAIWQQLDDKKKRALVDHELAHAGNDADGVYLIPHSIEEFSDIIFRNGIWKADVAEFADTVYEVMTGEEFAK